MLKGRSHRTEGKRRRMKRKERGESWGKREIGSSMQVREMATDRSSQDG